MEKALRWIDSQQKPMTELLEKWAGINSYSYHLPGLKRMADALAQELGTLGPVEWVDLPPKSSINSAGEVEHHALGQALRLIKRPDAPQRVLLNIHYDTVYPPESRFQKTMWVDQHTLRGPGVLDAKGGIVVLLTAVRALERSVAASNIGYEILLTPDEEIGSPGSGKLIVDVATRCKAALLFEPAMPDGSLVDARKGSGNFTFIVRGRAAHAGRDFHSGRSAVLAAAKMVLKLSDAFADEPEITINCGKLEGGEALNVVPDLAIARFNARAATPEQQRRIENYAAELASEFSQLDGITVTVDRKFNSPPKVMNPPMTKLLDDVIACGRELGVDLRHKPSGGASDGNRIAAAGVPVVDSLGPVGAELHSDREWIRVSSLVERAKLTALVLMKMADGRI